MATITFDIPDAAMPRVINAFASAYGYQPKLPNGADNPQTKAQFAKAIIRDFILSTVKAQEGQQASLAAVQASSEKVDNEVAVT